MSVTFVGDSSHKRGGTTTLEIFKKWTEVGEWIPVSRITLGERLAIGFTTLATATHFFVEERQMLKSLSVFAMLLGLGFFAVGCEPAADTTTTEPADTGAAGDMGAEDAAADPGTDDPAADPAAP